MSQPPHSSNHARRLKANRDALDLFAPIPPHTKRNKVTRANSTHELDTLKSLDLVAFNSKAEERFTAILLDLLKHHRAVSTFTAIQETAYRLNVSTETAKRYLLKHSASCAPFIIEEGQVRKRG